MLLLKHKKALKGLHIIPSRRHHLPQSKSFEDVMSSSDERTKIKQMRKEFPKNGAGGKEKSSEGA